jgi:hypothetical protein
MEKFEALSQMAGTCRRLWMAKCATLPKGYSFLALAMRLALSCIAAIGLLHRDKIIYVHFNDEAH